MENLQILKQEREKTNAMLERFKNTKKIFPKSLPSNPGGNGGTRKQLRRSLKNSKSQRRKKKLKNKRLTIKHVRSNQKWKQHTMLKSLK